MENRAARLLAIALPLVIGAASVAAAAGIDGAALRTGLQCAAVVIATAIGWRAGTIGERWAETDGERRGQPPARLAPFASDRRRPTFDRETGLHANWYFRLRAEEEIARAVRYGQPFTILSISSKDASALTAARLELKQWLRQVDFAGDLGNAIAILLPNTDRAGAETVLNRLITLAPRLVVRIAQYPIDGVTLSHLLGDDEWRVNEYSVEAG